MKNAVPPYLNDCHSRASPIHKKQTVFSMSSGSLIETSELLSRTSRSLATGLSTTIPVADSRTHLRSAEQPFTNPAIHESTSALRSRRIFVSLRITAENRVACRTPWGGCGFNVTFALAFQSTWDLLSSVAGSPNVSVRHRSQ